MSDNPFIIKVPEGTSEIDLGPILRPIIFKIREEIRSHEWKRHHGRPDLRLLEPDEIDAYVREAADELEYRRLLHLVTRDVLIAFLTDADWLPSDERGVEFVRDYYFKGRSWDYHGDKLYVYDGKRFDIKNVDEVVRHFTRYPPPTKLEVVRKILSFRSVLDQIVSEL